MKKILCLIAICIMCFSHINASEPGNNLNKSLYEIKQNFPDCVYWCESGRGQYYKTTDDELPIMFEIQNNKVISEFMLVTGSGSFPKDWYNSTRRAFLNSNYRSVLNDVNSCTFIYSYFTVYIRYDDYENNASITYELLPKYIN